MKNALVYASCFEQTRGAGFAGILAVAFGTSSTRVKPEDARPRSTPGTSCARALRGRRALLRRVRGAVARFISYLLHRVETTNVLTYTI